MVRRRETIEEQMARAQQDKKAATVRTSASSRGVRTPSRSASALLIASVLAALWAAIMLTGVGQTAYAYGFFFTEFFAGVVSLVALSLTVMLGLLATDRLVLRISHRVLMQSAHRATGVLGVAGLGFHVLTKIATGRAAATDALVPFVGGRGLYVGLGTVAALLMVSVIWTGIIRARFAGVGPKWLWRTLHSTAYLAWPFAVFHGLNAGRAAAPWVLFSYLGCILLVVLALLVRFSVTIGRRSREQHQAAVRNAVMAGRAEEAKTARSLLAGLGRRSKAADKRPAWAETTTATWAPPAARRDPERFTVPVVPEPGSLVEPTRPSRRRREEEPAARRDTERSSRSRRTEETTTSRSARRSVEDTGTFRRDEEELEPVSRRRASRTRDEDVPTGRRRADEVTSERSRRRSRDEDDGSRYSAPPQPTLAEPEEPWDSPRRWQADDPISAGPISVEPISAGPVSSSPISSAPRSGSGRHSADDDLPEEPDYWRPPARYVPDEVAPPVDDTPTLVDLASRRARRAAGEGKSKRRKASADAVDGAYWAGLRGEAK
ncbi:ferric reductase-like transmembrane domain-containing protein [Micromonospora hortensis]|uniref:ferric reductase-like transmembrane domain-containing protein n=1 Tax=Micromonospora hortensis TaxID=2911209 RepID=UPI001EE9003A|nr:ferric reductase-like transmembrane domain-containing protein [Micromonospora hortensis]MCG5452962.1 ferric reductase-like transmembrane domain-containing protein [Micromonospora hortensis]